MRLVIKIALIYAIISFVVVLISGYINYNVISRVVDEEERYFLEDRLKLALDFIDKSDLKKEFDYAKMKITPLPELVEETRAKFRDTLMMHETLKRIEPHLRLDVIKNVNDKSYQIMIYDLIVEADDIEDVVRETMEKTYIILLIVLLVISFIVSYYLLQPFNRTLEAIKTFSLKNKSGLKLERTSTIEFDKLNKFIEEMTNKVRSDYRSLKEFSENASHEIQTPISIVQGKLDLLMESPLNEDQMELISTAQTSLKRLSKMSNSLGLLTKIENREFSNFSEVDMSDVVNRVLAEFKELLVLKSIELETEIKEGIAVTGNDVLLGILFSNLLNNAVRHNRSDGYIKVILHSESLVLENSGAPLEVDPALLFRRFKKGSDNPESSGLGLSIAKRICEEHDFSLDYQAEGGHHRLTVGWIAST